MKLPQNETGDAVLLYVYASLSPKRILVEITTPQMLFARLPVFVVDCPVKMLQHFGS